MNGTPVRPSRATIVSGLPAASDPPTAKPMSPQREAGVRQRRPGRGHGQVQPGLAFVTAERVDADPGHGHAAFAHARTSAPAGPRPVASGANAYAATVVPSERGNGSITSRIGMPIW